MPDISCILWTHAMAQNPKDTAIANIRQLMLQRGVTAVDIEKGFRPREDGEDVRGDYVRAILAGRNDKGLALLGEYLRDRFDMPPSWPDLVEAHGLPLAAIPHVGSASAGRGAETDPGFDPVMVPASWVTNRTLGMTVLGDSMFPVLMEGDHLLVEPAEKPIDGHIMVFRTLEGLVVKTPYMEQARWVLRSINEEYPAIDAKQAEARAIGLVIGIYRASGIVDEEMAIRRKGGWVTESLVRRVAQTPFLR